MLHLTMRKIGLVKTQKYIISRYPDFTASFHSTSLKLKGYPKPMPNNNSNIKENIKRVLLYVRTILVEVYKSLLKYEFLIGILIGILVANSFLWFPLLGIDFLFFEKDINHTIDEILEIEIEIEQNVQDLHLKKVEKSEKVFPTCWDNMESDDES